MDSGEAFVMSKTKSNMLLLLSTSLVVLVWISLLLGRIYYQSYIEWLGLPRSESHLPLMDYALVSPNVAVLGTGLFASVPAVLAVALSISTAKSTSWARSIAYSILSLLLVAFPAIAINVFPLESIVDHTGTGLFAILLVVFFICVSVSTLLYMASIFSSPPLSGASAVASIFGRPVPEDIRRTIRTAGAVFFAASLLVGVAVFSVIYAEDFGKIDARNVLKNAKEVDVIFTNSDSGYVADLCGNGSGSCTLKVPFIGERFIYLLPDDVELFSEDGEWKSPRLHAVSVNNVIRISY